jgi:hypothetical protein
MYAIKRLQFFRRMLFLRLLRSHTLSSHARRRNMILLMLTERKLRSQHGLRGPRGPYNIPKSSNWYNKVLFNYDDREFRKAVRIDKTSFWHLVDTIGQHNCFHQTGTKHQAPVAKQAAVFLRRMGSQADNFDIAALFGISEGTVMKYCARVCEAILAMAKDHITWPKGEYRDQVHEGFESIAGFPDVIGYIDGAHFPLFEAPSTKSKDTYFSRKHRYAVHAQGIVDHLGHFTSTNWVASFRSRCTSL